jgi:hypothetical protein
VAFAVNTDWGFLQPTPSKTVYLHGQQWLPAPTVDGLWTAGPALPASFGRLPPDDNRKDVRAALPLRTATATPTVFVSTAPAEPISCA